MPARRICGAPVRHGTAYPFENSRPGFFGSPYPVESSIVGGFDFVFRCLAALRRSGRSIYLNAGWMRPSISSQSVSFPRLGGLGMGAVSRLVRREASRPMRKIVAARRKIVATRRKIVATRELPAQRVLGPVEACNGKGLALASPSDSAFVSSVRCGRGWSKGKRPARGTEVTGCLVGFGDFAFIEELFAFENGVFGE